MDIEELLMSAGETANKITSRLDHAYAPTGENRSLMIAARAYLLKSDKALRTLRDERDAYRDSSNRLTSELTAQRAHKSAAEQVQYLKVSREQCQAEVERWKALCRDAMLELDNTVTRQAISAALGEQP